jgi:DNA-binding transcriptional LysR family regulator
VGQSLPDRIGEFTEADEYAATTLAAWVLQEGADFVITSGAGHTEAEIGARVPIAESIFERVMLAKRPACADHASSRLRLLPGVPELRSALLVPLVYRSETLGDDGGIRTRRGIP